MDTKNEEEFLKNMSYQRFPNRERNVPEIDIKQISPDKPLAVTVVFLVVIGLMMIFSASAQKCIDMGVGPLKFFIQQLLGVIAGVAGMYFLSNKDYKKMRQYTFPFVCGVIFLLILVKLVGTTVNGAQRWLYIGPLNLQPAELAKPAVVFLMAGAFYKNAKIFTKQKFLLAYLPILIMVGFIFIQPNLSMVLLLLATSITLYLAAGGLWQLIVGVGAPGIVFLLLHGLRDYQSSRIMTWLHPEADPLGAGYNILQSLVAIASGGFMGVGYGNAKQKLAWLPEAHTDFIFSAAGEEFGFVGCVLIIALLFIIIFKCFHTARRSRTSSGSYMCVGVAAMLLFHVYENIAMCMGLMPVTGIPLPFFSYGGSSMVSTLLAMGLVMNVWARSGTANT